MKSNHARGNPQIGRTTALLSVALVLPLIAAAGLAGAQPLPATSSLPLSGGNQWAYGAQRWINASGISSNGQWTLEAFVGWHVILTQTNLTNGTDRISAERAMGTALYVTYCVPNCAAATESADFSEKGTEVTFASSLLTDQGVVSVAGANVPALAIIGSNSSMAANLTESYHAVVHGLLGVSHSASGNLAVTASASSVVTFSPALGILPLNLTPGESWSSSATFNASGNWAWTASSTRTFPNGTTVSGAANLSGSPSRSGSIALVGVAAPPLGLSGNQSADPVLIEVTGPFLIREGLIFVPGNANLFSESSLATSRFAGHPVISTGQVDVRPTVAGHLGLLASTASFDAVTAPPSTTDAAPIAEADLGSSVPVANPQTGTNSTVVQAEPESVAQAEQGIACVQGPCTALANQPAPTHNPLLSGGFLAIAVIAIFSVAVVALVASRRRSIPPPPQPGASLYPPGAQAAPPPSAPPAAPGKNPSAPAPPDPLDHLW